MGIFPWAVGCGVFNCIARRVGGGAAEVGMCCAAALASWQGQLPAPPSPATTQPGTRNCIHFHTGMVFKF